MIKRTVVGALVGVIFLCGGTFQQDTPKPYVAEQICHLAVEAPEALTKKYVFKEPETFNVTAYTLNENECGRSISDPAYGLTSSGVYVTEWHTIAASSELPFGTLIYFPYFKDKPNGGVFVVEDRGGAITEGHIDVYFRNVGDADAFGRRNLNGYIITRNEFDSGDYQMICKE